MTLFIGNISALDFWRTHEYFAMPSSRDRARMTDYAQKAFNIFRAEDLDCSSAIRFGFDEPIHFLVPNHAARFRNPQARAHIWTTPLPKKSMIRLAHDVYISSPEFALLQMAKPLSFLELIVLVMEFCGTYALVPADPLDAVFDVAFDASPDMPVRDYIMRQREFSLLTKMQLQEFLAAQSSAHGCAKLLRATKYAFENSGSPMETLLALLLCLPHRLGGYALPRPELNPRIDPPSKYAHLANQNFYQCDLYWPKQKVAVEYDSDMYHAYADKMAHDAQRRNDLEALGISMITVTARQVFSSYKLDSLARQIAKMLDARIRFTQPGFSDVQFRLCKELQGHLHISNQSNDQSNG